MTITNNQFAMIKLIKIFRKVIYNPYVGVCASLLIILPSLYVVLGDTSVFRKEYVFLAVGIPLYLKSLKRIFDEIFNSK